MSKENGKLINAIYEIICILKIFVKVRNHCLVKDEYRGSTHQICNANFRPTKIYLPYFITSEDTMVVSQCKKLIFYHEINVIPHGMKKYIDFTLGKNLFTVCS